MHTYIHKCNESPKRNRDDEVEMEARASNDTFLCAKQIESSVSTLGRVRAADAQSVLVAVQEQQHVLVAAIKPLDCMSVTDRG